MSSGIRDEWAERGGYIMSIARIVAISSTSDKGFEDAVLQGVPKHPRHPRDKKVHGSKSRLKGTISLPTK
jgi:hypothetical protein